MRRAKPLRDERGMTMIEVLVAMVVLVVGVLGLLSVFSTSGALNTRSEREAQATAWAQRQVEGYRALDYANVALSTCSGTGSWANLRTAGDPLYQAPLATETSVCDTTNGRIAPNGTWEDDRMAVRGSVYRYVTQPSPDVKRIVVAVFADGAGRLSKPVVVEALKPDPSVGGAGTTYFRSTDSPCQLIGLICLS
jgi:prepilin-type N-terminal cleavage/methylation domain-containing protein